MTKETFPCHGLDMPVEVESRTMPELVIKKPSFVLADTAQGVLAEAVVLKVVGIGENECACNTTKPFMAIVEGRETYVVAARIDPVNTEGKGKVQFFTPEYEFTALRHLHTVNPLDLAEDPAVATINGEFVLITVSVSPDSQNPDILTWRTVFWKNGGGNNLHELKEINRGPEGMKDIRFLQLKDGRLVFFTRPEVEKEKRVGWVVLNNIEEFEAPDLAKVLQEAKIIEDLFVSGEWGGVNDVIELENGLLGVLAHVAKYDEHGNKDYRAFTFEFDIETGNFYNPHVVATRDHFPKGEGIKIKRLPGRDEKHLENVVFLNGMCLTEDGRVDLFGGASDAEPVMARIPYPFSCKPKL